jgi:peptidoglycan/xylan/chitin deacetylase (PgdA/CDA1 family)
LSIKHAIFKAGLTGLSLTGTARLMAKQSRGAGAILMFHHVRHHQRRGFDPNRILAIDPSFLDAVLTHLAKRGYEVIPLDAVPERLASGGPPFAVLTFDDGYLDNLTDALPVLKRHNAPFTIYITTGFADRTAPLWWRDIEDSLRILPDVTIEGQYLPLQIDQQRTKAYGMLMEQGRRQAYPALQEMARALAARAGLEPLSLTERECLSWDQIRRLADEPLATIGVHTLTHPLLALMPLELARREMVESRDIIRQNTGRDAVHFAYPVGDPVAAGTREFTMAKEFGFKTAVTTRPGVLFPDHAGHLHALPRVSVNGLYQSIRDFDVLLSGAAFMLFNRGRRVNVG